MLSYYFINAIVLDSCTEKLSRHLIVVVLQCSAKYSFTIAGS